MIPTATGSLIIKREKLDAIDTAINAMIDLYLPSMRAEVEAVVTTTEDEAASKAALLADDDILIVSALLQLGVRVFERVCQSDPDSGLGLYGLCQRSLQQQLAFRQSPRDASGIIISG